MTANSNLGAALVAALDDETVAQLAERLRPHLAAADRPGRLLTAREVAERLGLHPKTVARMACDGRLHAVKVGRSWRFYADVLAVRPPRAGVREIAPSSRRRVAPASVASVQAIRGASTLVRRAA